MKNLIYLGLIAGLLACQTPAKQRYFTESPEIDMAKAMIDGYLSDDYSATRTTYSETAEIHHNSMEAINPEQLIAGFESQNEVIETKDFIDPIYEMIIDSDEETWVMFWSEWKGTLTNGKTISVPVHVSWRFTDGKVDMEWGYYDNQILNSALNEGAEEVVDSGEETTEEESVE